MLHVKCNDNRFIKFRLNHQHKLTFSCNSTVNVNKVCFSFPQGQSFHFKLDYSGRPIVTTYVMEAKDLDASKDVSGNSQPGGR